MGRYVGEIIRRRVEQCVGLQGEKLVYVGELGVNVGCVVTVPLHETRLLTLIS